MSLLTLLQNATIVNEGREFIGSVLIENQIIKQVFEQPFPSVPGAQLIDLAGKYLLPGVIDDQVHFRQPGMEYKADIYSESRAAVAGGVTSFMDMPNNNPPVLTQELLEKKYSLAADNSMANYSFYMGASNDNIEEVLKTDFSKVCGVKVFMGSSTGNMLVDDDAVLEQLFARVPGLIATHCEDETTIRQNMQKAKAAYGDDIPVAMHPVIRSAEACFLSSSKAVALARKHHTRLHILHLTTAREMDLFDKDIPLIDKKITAEVCVHHLWFSQDDYETQGTKIKCNPAIKTGADRRALMQALIEGRLDVVATDHAPHTADEKAKNYFKAPSGLPLVQHSLMLMLEFYHHGELPLTTIVQKMCHAPADCFRIQKRGYIRPGFFADLVVVDLKKKTTVAPYNIHYKCGWSPFEGQSFHSQVITTFVNGKKAYDNGNFPEENCGERLTFDIR